MDLGHIDALLLRHLQVVVLMTVASDSNGSKVTRRVNDEKYLVFRQRTRTWVLHLPDESSFVAAISATHSHSLVSFFI